MEENGAFNHLVSDLDNSEKIQLLEKLKTQSVFSDEPLIDAKLNGPQDKPAAKYAKLPWWTRLWYWFIGIFSGKTPPEIFLNVQLANAGREINLLYPGMFDYQKLHLQEGCRHELISLKDAARFFYTLLDSSVNRDRGAFMGYLASLALPDIHNALLENTDPNILSISHPELADIKQRSLALDYIEAETSKIPEETHGDMYQNARTLFCLKELSSFLFDRLIMSFNQSNQEEGIICPFSIVKNQLVALSNILFSIKKTPSMDLLSALFIFSMQEYQNDKGFDIDRELQRFIQQAEKAVAVIRSFNKRVPLTKIIRCATRELSWEPKELPGGEDWFAVYKGYWLDSTKSKFIAWMLARRTKELNEGLRKFFTDIEMIPLDYAASEENEDGVPVDASLALSFLLTFHKKIFMPEINVIIRPILIDGEFYKRDNRVDFTESYNVLIKLDDTIKEFDHSLAPAGDIGKLWAQAEAEVQSITIRKRKVHSILEEVEGQVEKIISNAYNALALMDKVLNGIASGSQGGKYDTLTNLAKIQGKGTQFIDGLHAAIDNIHNAVKLLDSIKAVKTVEE
jgi:hypothetical protein